MSSFPAGLTPADVPLHWSLSTAAGQLTVAGLELHLTLAADWQGVRPAGALASWLSESGAQGLQLDEPAGSLRFSDVTVAGAAHRGQLLSWWLSAISSGDEVWSAIGRMASVWATVGFPAADAHAWFEGTGLVVWKTAGPHSAVVFVRPLRGPTPMPALRCAFLDQPSASAHRQALRTALPLTPDPALDAVAGWGQLGWSAWLVGAGVTPGQIAAGIQLAENLVRRAPALAALLAQTETRAGDLTVGAPPSPFEAVGGAAPLPAALALPAAPPAVMSQPATGAPAPLPGTTVPAATAGAPVAALTPASAVVIPRTEASAPGYDSGSFSAVPSSEYALAPAQTSSTAELELPSSDGLAPPSDLAPEPQSLPTSGSDSLPSDAGADADAPSSDESAPPEPALLLERPRVSIPIPDEVPELPEATSSDRFDLWLMEVAADPDRTVELMARSLRLDREAAAELCRQAPVVVARNIAAWEVRKLDAVVRLGGGGRLRWDRIQPPAP